MTVVARGSHGQAIANDGLVLRSPLGDAHVRPVVVERVSELPELDCVVFATKSFQLPAAAAEASKLAGPFVAFGLQNGVTAANVLRASLPKANVLGATCRVISLIESPGVIHHVGAHPEIIVGAQDATLSATSQEMASALAVGDKLSVISSDRIYYEIWNKFLFFAPISGVGSASGLTIGSLREAAPWRKLLAEAVSEIAQLAAAIGVPLGSDAVDRTLAFVDSLPAGGTSSLQRDIQQGRSNELPDLSGRVVQMGREFGIETPAHARIVQLLSAYEGGTEAP